MKIRIDRDANYRAIFNEGKTLRLRIDPTKPISTPKTAEIEDVAINSKCFANCSYCYTSATKNGQNFDNILEKARNVWGFKDENERPFQIAIGGAGEPTIHPGFIAFLKEVHGLGIVPNYTTNGMHLSNDDIDATEKYCGGVAVSLHPHIVNVFDKAIRKLHNRTRLNAHVIVGQKKSLDVDLKWVYGEHGDKLDYIVVLPYQAVGRGVEVNTHDVWVKTFDWIASLPEDHKNKFAFGALFYPWMLENKIPLDIDIYEPEIYSGYRIFDDSYRILRKSSYDLTPKFTTNNETQ